MGAVKLSKRSIDALSVERGDKVFWDRDQPGFGIRVHATGRKIYVAQARTPGGLPKRGVIGRYVEMTTEEARRKAAGIIDRIRRGEDPVPPPTAPEPTVADLAECYMTAHVAVNCRPATVESFGRLLRLYILPELGGLKLTEVDRSHVSALHHKMRGKPSQANQALSVLSKMFKLAMAWGMTPARPNPCRSVRRYKQRSCERFLTADEYARLGRVLFEAEAEGPRMVAAVAAIRLLLLTGCRRNEILTLRWDDLDRTAGELRLRDSKTGPRRVTANHDDDAIADPPFAIAHAASGGDYAGVVSSTDPLEVTVTEDDMEGFAVVPSALTIAEEATGTFAVALTSAPAGTVEVEAAVSGDNEVTVTPVSRTFDASDWDDAQSFTVAAGDDPDSDDDTATVTVRVKSGSYGAPDVPVAVTVDDNDDPSTKVTLTVAPAGVAEDAGATAVTVTGMLDGAPRGDDTQVIVTVSDGPIQSRAEADEFEPVNAFVLTIAAGSRTGTAQFTFTPVDNDVDGPDRKVSVYGAIVGSSISVEPVELTILDDDTRGVAVTPSSVTVTEEDGAGASYTVRLESQPTGPVTVHADPPAGTAVRVAPASRTFTASSWNTPQAFTVSAVHDADSVDETGLAIAHRVTGADYQGDTVEATVAVTVIDDDIPDVVVSALSVAIAEGGSATYTVKLNTQPSDTVTVTLTPAPDNSELTLDPASLAFGTGDWETAQTVTVTANHDDDAIADPPFAIAHAASGGDYAGVVSSTDPLEVTVTEDDMEGFAVVPSALTIAEEATGTFTVALTSAPAGTVEVEAAVSGGNEVTVTPAALVFDASNWDDAQTFTVAAGDDTDSDDDTATVTVRVKSGSYGAPAVPVGVTVDDNDDPSTKVTLNVAPAEVAEDAGATAVTVTGMLDGAPRGLATAVTVTVSAGTGADGAEAADFASVTPFTLTIAAGSRSGTADFTFTPVDDDVDEGDETVAVGGSAVGLAVEAADLAIREDDARGIVLSKTAVSPTEGEAGETYGVTLASKPTGNVTVFADAPAGTDVRVAPASRTFTPTNWDTEQTFAVSAVDDPDSSDITGLAIAHRVAGADYQGHSVADTVAVTIVDDDVAGIHAEADAATVEEGGTLDLRVKLNTLPSGPVTVTLTPSDSELTLNPTSLTFNTGDWETLQTVEVTAAHDDDARADPGFMIVLAASGAGYNGITENFALTVTEDDVEGIEVDPTTLEVAEGVDDEAGDIAVRLTSAPVGTVTIEAVLLAGSDPDVTVRSVRSFSPSNWNDTKPFRVVGGNDADSDDDTAMVEFRVRSGDYGADPETVAVSFDASNWDETKPFRVVGAEDADSDDDTAVVEFRVRSGDDYGADPERVDVTVDDNDDPSTKVTLTVLPTAGIPEGGGTIQAYVEGTLDGVPRNTALEVTVSVTAVSGANGADATDFEPVTPFTLTIPAQATSAGAFFDFTPVDDAVDEDDETVSVSGTTTAQTTDGDPFTVVAAALTIRDDDTRAIVIAGGDLTGAGALAVTEGGDATWTVALASKPTATVTVTVGGWSGTEFEATPATLTFIPGDWHMAQPVTVSLAHDDDGIDEAVLTLTHAAADGDYEGLAGPEIRVSATDDDTPAVEVSETRLDLAEGGADGTYTVVLATEPGQTVTVTPAPDAALEGGVTVSPPSLVFTSVNWRNEQTVTVTPVDDNNDKVNAEGRIGHSVAGTGEYAGVTAAPVEVVVVDDDKTEPGAPNLTEAKPGYEEVRLAWQAPADDGGHPIDGWEVSVDGGAWTPTGSVARAHTVTGLVNEVDYVFRVRAVNTIGPSLPSNSLTAAPVPVIITLHLKDDQPTVTVEEGKDACFYYRSSHYAAPTRVEKEYRREGDFMVDDAVSGQVVITGFGFGAHDLEHCKKTVNDDEIEPDGTYTITLLPGEGYLLGDPSTQTVKVLDNDQGRLPGRIGRW